MRPLHLDSVDSVGFEPTLHRVKAECAGHYTTSPCSPSTSALVSSVLRPDRWNRTTCTRPLFYRQLGSQTLVNRDAKSSEGHSGFPEQPSRRVMRGEKLLLGTGLQIAHDDPEGRIRMGRLITRKLGGRLRHRQGRSLRDGFLPAE